MEVPPLMNLPVDSIIGVTELKKVKQGDVIARVPKESSKQKISLVDYLE